MFRVVRAMEDCLRRLGRYVGSHAGDPSVEFRSENLHAIGSGFVETLFVKHLLEELGHDERAEVHTDSQVAQSVVLSQGLRKMKHVELRFFFRREVTNARRGLDLLD